MLRQLTSIVYAVPRWEIRLALRSKGVFVASTLSVGMSKFTCMFSETFATFT